MTLAEINAAVAIMTASDSASGNDPDGSGSFGTGSVNGGDNPDGDPGVGGPGGGDVKFSLLYPVSADPEDSSFRPDSLAEPLTLDPSSWLSRKQLRASDVIAL